MLGRLLLRTPRGHESCQELLVGLVFSLIVFIKFFLFVALPLIFQVNFVLLAVFVLGLGRVLHILVLVHLMRLLEVAVSRLVILVLLVHRLASPLSTGKALPSAWDDDTLFALVVTNLREAHAQNSLHPQGVVYTTAIEQDLRLLVVRQASTSQHLTCPLLIGDHDVRVLCLQLKLDLAQVRQPLLDRRTCPAMCRLPSCISIISSFMFHPLVGTV